MVDSLAKQMIREYTPAESTESEMTDADQPYADEESMVSYREATPEDHVRLADFGREMFVETWGELYDAADMNDFLNVVYAYSSILRDFEFGRRFWIASIDDRWIGYIKTGAVGLPVELGDRRALELKQLYVTREYHGRQVGHRLMAYFIQQCHDTQCDEAYISCFSGNHRALRFYAKYGFVECGRYIFRVGKQEDDECILKRDLRASRV